MSIEKLIPFVLRSGQLEVGRERLLQVRKHLAGLLVTEDISENSLRKLMRDFSCPIYCRYTVDDMERMFQLRGTKLVGLRHSSLTNQILSELKPWRLKNGAYEIPPHAKVAVLGISGIGKHHANWWAMEGATLCGFLGSSPESVERAAAELQRLYNRSCTGYTNLQTLLETEQPDIVDVCLPPAMHEAAVRTALEAGCHVLCEKPFVYVRGMAEEVILTQARNLEGLARQKHRLLGVASQYVMAAKACLNLLPEGAMPPKRMDLTLAAPLKDKIPDALDTWTDLAPHLLAVIQVALPGAQPDWQSLKWDWHGCYASAKFTCIHGDGQGGTRCRIVTEHTDNPPVNIRRLGFGDHVYDIEGQKDEAGVFQMCIHGSDGQAVQSEDMLRLLIRGFLHQRVEMPAPMAVQNLEWMLQVMKMI